jgi:flagellar hook-basal body complex protein FliE
MAPILPITPSIPPIQAPSVAGVTGASTAGGAAFQSAFNDAVQQVEGFGQNASASINSFLSGEGEELHDVAIKTQQAEMSFDLFLQVRNKVVSAYQEVMRMQV